MSIGFSEAQLSPSGETAETDLDYSHGEDGASVDGDFDPTTGLDPEIVREALCDAYGTQVARGVEIATSGLWPEIEDADMSLRTVINNVTAWNNLATPQLHDGPALNPERQEEVKAAAAFLSDVGLV